MEIIVDFALNNEEISNLNTYRCIEVLEVNNMELSQTVSMVKIKILDLQEFLEQLHF